MDRQKEKQLKKLRRKAKVRAKVNGVKDCPRLSVFRSNKGMYLQLIDDTAGITLASANISELKTKSKDKSGKSGISFELGKLLAKKAMAKKIKQVVFDRGGFKYHGRVKAAAEGAREGGLKF